MMTKEAGKKIIAERVEEFEKNKAILTKKGHGETNIRSNYIDIMFKALGWNMKSHYDVVREFSQRDRSNNGGTKKIDYAFKINGKLKFFIEAKEASVDLEKDKSAIYQAKRYAYSSNGKAPIVILTDFEEFRVFNVIKAPLMDNTDRELLKSHTMRYTDYLEKWDLLWDAFSREAVENGSLDKLRGKIDKNVKTMDVDFLEQITSWRELLARNIAIRNENLNVDEINEAVQRILDRLVFIRNLEDREIEPENTLLDKTKKSENIYKSLIPMFNSLNKTYNGLLFKKHFSEDIDVDDKTIHDIIRQMSYPVSPFQFDVIEPEILGRIYEKFLGSKIRLTDSHRAKIEEKIEVRKAGGVYYTPEYIVEYIVQNTVGSLLRMNRPLKGSVHTEGSIQIKESVQSNSQGLSPEEIKNIKICDPACGSGSFLIGAYAYILDYHQKWYTENQKDKSYQADWYKTNDGEIKVCLDKRGDILKNNIFGVDIDKEATEVATMSLYLKMLDDGFDKGQKDLFFIKGHVLPDMKENIKCGNSLIGTDYFDFQRTDGLSPLFSINNEELKRIKPFDWDKEFPVVFGKKEISRFHLITFETKYSRISNGNEAVLLEPKEIDLIIDCFKDTKEKFGFKILACSILPDHVHIVIADMGQNIEKIVNHLKGFSSFTLNRALKGTVQGKGRQLHLWAKSYNNSFLETETHLFSAIEYVKSNHLKHADKWKYDDYTQTRLNDIIDPFSKMADYEYKSGGFDVVIGNPPWGQKATEFNDNEKIYFKKIYPSSTVGILDLSRFFIEKSLDIIKENGHWGQVLPDIILLKNYETTRKHILDNLKIINIVHWGMAFIDVNLDSCTIIGTKNYNVINNIINIYIHEKNNNFIQNTINQDIYNKIDGYKFNLYLNNNIFSILSKLTSYKKFSDYFETHEGIHTGNIRSKLFLNENININCKKLIFGRDEVKRYLLNWNGMWVNYSKDIIKKNEYAGLGKKEYFECSKIIIRRTGDFILANIDEIGYYFSNNVFVCVPNHANINLKIFLGILNSKIMTWFYRSSQPRVGKLFAEIKINLINQLPIPDLGVEEREPITSALAGLVDNMLQTQKDYHNCKSESDKKLFEQKINLLDKKIDEIVYKLYNLTEDEIKIIEG